MPYRWEQIEDYWHQLELRNQLYRRHGYDVERELQEVVTFCQPLPDRILEIGTGQGRFLMTLLRHGARVTTLDNNQKKQRLTRIAVAQENLPGQVRYIVADATRLPWRRPTFDLVVSANTLHHISNIPLVVREAARVTLPGGRLVLADFNTRGLALLASIHRREGRCHKHTRYRFASLRNYLSLSVWRTELRQTEHLNILIAEKSG